ncbi:MAG: bifunctional oligoribonuclease/PAP phosphatase NrnA [Trichlorobacter sp.]|jgi:phosphoesterase RecJ-like protein|nr:bifunctional oligoribonuclease/PAP phosphatase NrnA [Trichlorobacter sp.]
MTGTISKIVDAIRKSSSVLIVSHEGPDGDAVGSSLGLAAFLRAVGKDVLVHLADPVPELYRFLPGADQVAANIPDRNFDLAFVLDVGELRRAGKEFCDFSQIGSVINIDHHLTCENFGAINLIDEKAAATAVLVWKVADAYGFTPDYATAICLYVGITTDTGSFRYSNADREAFEVAGRLLEAGGFSAWDVSEKLYESQPRKQLELLSCALSTLEFVADGRAASITVTTDMYEKTGAGAELTDGFVNYPRSVSGVEVAILFRQLDDKRFKIGFRSKGAVNVADIAQKFGGGGHHNAAGGVVEGDLNQVKQIVYGAIQAFT